MSEAGAAPKISEKAFMAQLVAFARTLGWRVYHPWLSIHSERGYPDLTLCRPPHLLVVECKTETGQLTPSQREWLDALAACGVEAFCWRPSSWPEIERVLTAGTGIQVRR